MTIGSANTGDPEQIWKFIRQGDGSYCIQNMFNDNYLTYEGNCVQQAKVTTSWLNTNKASRFQWYIYDKNGTFQLVPKDSVTAGTWLVLDCTGNYQTPGTQMELYSNWSGAAQIFSLYPVDDYQKPAAPPKVEITVPDVATVGEEVKISWTASPLRDKYDQREYCVTVQGGGSKKVIYTTDTSVSVTIKRRELHCNVTVESRNTKYANYSSSSYATFKCVEAHEHSYTAVVTAPTCTEKGYTTHTCSCGHSYVDTYTDALGHAWDNGKVTKEPTETETGVKTFTCTRCGDAYTEELIPTVAVNLQVGGSYTFTTANADITETADASIVSVSVRANAAGYSRVTSVSEGRYLLVCNGSLLTTNSSTYYSSWDGAGTVSGLACVSYSAGGSYDAYLWTIKAVPGGYTVQSADGRYLSLTAGTRSSNLTLSDTAQVLTISDLGETFSITSGSAYLDRYSSSFAASYPGAGNVNEQWQLYRAQEADYDVTITGVSEGETSVVLGGVRYAVTVHAHHYTEETTAPATCTESGTMTYTCAGCGDSYTETIPALGHDYVRTEQDGQYVYTCTRCGESYTEPIVTTTYRSVSSISSGSSYVITVYSYGKYYALTHTGGALGVTAVTVSNGQIVSDVTDDMLWTYSGGKLGFTSGGANYYLGRYGYSSLSISTSGSRASYSSSRLSLGGYYLRYSNGYFSLNWRSASTCYMFEQTN